MAMENKILMQSARESLRGKWGPVIGGLVVYIAVSMAASIVPILGPLASFLIAGSMTLGITIFFLNVSRSQEFKIEQIFKGFNRFATALAAYFFMQLFIFLWALLFIIPGIIAALSYSMTFYILADNNSIGGREAIKMSKEMMKGNKMKLFLLQIRFIGWALLCILTLGIGFLWLFPYVSVSIAKFYDDIKGGMSIKDEEEE